MPFKLPSCLLIVTFDEEVFFMTQYNNDMVESALCSQELMDTDSGRVVGSNEPGDFDEARYQLLFSLFSRVLLQEPISCRPFKPTSD